VISIFILARALWASPFSFIILICLGRGGENVVDKFVEMDPSFVHFLKGCAMRLLIDRFVDCRQPLVLLKEICSEGSGCRYISDAVSIFGVDSALASDQVSSGVCHQGCLRAIRSVFILELCCSYISINVQLAHLIQRGICGRAVLVTFNVLQCDSRELRS
jgi:hypothetical protein